MCVSACVCYVSGVLCVRVWVRVCCVCAVCVSVWYVCVVCVVCVRERVVCVCVCVGVCA